MRRLLAFLLFFTLAFAAERLYVAPDDGVGYLKALIRSAEQEIDLALYLWTRGRLDLAEELARVKQRGVRVRVILDERPGGEPQDSAVLEALRAAGIEVRFASPLRFAHYHIKALRADGRLWISTGNWTRASFSSNREYSLVTDRADWVAEFKRVFAADWEARALPLDDAKLVWSPERVYSIFRPFWEGNAKRRILGLIASAEREVFIEQNGFTDEDVYNALLEAMDRGVRVRILGSASARKSGYFGQMARRLAEQGAEVRYLSGLKVHAKAMLLDGRIAFLGSQNFTPTALTANRELGAVINEGRALLRLKATMERDWARARAAVRPPSGAVPWYQAGRYLGQVIQVEGQVIGIKDAGGVYRLLFDPTERFVVVIPKSVARRFPLQSYVGRTLRVTGRVRTFRGRPEIVVKSPNQIEEVR